MDVAFAAILFLYSTFVVVVMVVFMKAIASPSKVSNRLHKISVVVAARNEEHNIERVVETLLAQDYPQFEIIVVDDHSTDHTKAFVQSISDPRVKVIPNTGNGKKSAITTGVSMATGEIIACTDADCVVLPGWLGAVDDSFATDRVHMTFGGVRLLPSKTFFSKLQSLEFASVIGVGAATASMGIPTMCNGANMAFRKVTFAQVDGYNGNLELASGDDEFLMRKVSRLGVEAVSFDSRQERVVSTNPQPSVKAFVHQRLRWASKWTHNTSAVTVAIALFVVLVQVATLACWWLAGQGQLFAIIALADKVIAEALLLQTVGS
jgi:poly-beta-1,6-N-acetyl-D-glucosamine synthase